MKILVFVLALAAAAQAQGLTVDTVLGFEDTMPVRPRLVVTNHSNEPAYGVNVYWTLFDGTPNGYSDSIAGLYFGIRTTETLGLGGWIPDPRSRDSVGLLIYLTWVGDTVDTWYKEILPRFPDVAVTEITAPLDTLDSGAVIWPSSEVANVGTIDAHFSMVHEIGDYVCHDSVTLLPDERRVIAASESLLALPGVWTIKAWAYLSGDMDPTNNIMTDTFWVRPFPGVEETRNDERGTMNGGATVLRRLPAGAVAFDAMGRRVPDPKTGVYFVWEQSAISSQHSGRSAASGGRDMGVVWKVVLTK
jgi:hypothetical protein